MKKSDIEKKMLANRLRKQISESKEKEIIISKGNTSYSLNESELKSVIDEAVNNVLKLNNIVETICEDDVTQTQLRKAANINAWNPNSVRIKRNSNGDLTTVRLTNRWNGKKALSRLVIKLFADGKWKRPRIIKDTQDKLVRLYNDIINKDVNNGYLKIKRKHDNVINKPCVILVGTKTDDIKCLYIETDDLTYPDRFFDIFAIKRFLLKYHPEISIRNFHFPDEPVEQNNNTPNKTNIQTNWDWIKNGEPKKYRTFDQ